MTSLVAKNDHTSAVNEQGKPHVVQGQRKNAQATKTTLQDLDEEATDRREHS